MSDVDDAIAQYRGRMLASARLAECDLDELEDHMRELIDDLQTRGVPVAVAIRQAAERLGNPQDVAREHVRARRPFGAPLSTARALGAALLFGVPAALWAFQLARFPVFSVRSWAETLIWMFLAIALVARSSWTRPVIIGLVTHRLAFHVVMPIEAHPVSMIFDLATLALVAPWSRSEHSLASVGLAFRAWTVLAAGTTALSVSFMGHGGVYVDACTTTAMVLALISCVGSIRGARYDVTTGLLSALALIGAIGGVLVTPMSLEGAAAWRVCAIVVGTSGILASMSALLVSLRSGPDARIRTA